MLGPRGRSTTTPRQICPQFDGFAQGAKKKNCKGTQGGQERDFNLDFGRSGLAYFADQEVGQLGGRAKSQAKYPKGGKHYRSVYYRLGDSECIFALVLEENERGAGEGVIRQIR